jgi:hypothetical protein
VVSRVLLGIAFAAIALAVFALRPSPTPGPALRDFEAYWSAGAAHDEAADPYSSAIWSAERHVPGVDASRDEMLPFVGPPAALPLWGLLARLPYARAAAIWGAFLALSLAALVAAAVLGAGARAAAAFLAALALALGCGPITSALALGQVALPAFAGACIFALLAPSNLALAIPAAALALAQPNAALGLLSQIGGKRAAAGLAVAAALAYAAGALAAGWSWPVAYARTLADHLRAERFDAIQFTPASIAFGLGATHGAAAAAAWVLALAAVAAAVALARRAGDRFARFAAFSALSPFVATFFHEHDLVVAFPAAVWTALHARGRTRAVALAGTLLVCIDWLGLAQRPSAIAQSAFLAIAAGCAFGALGGAGDLRWLTAAGSGVALTFAVAARAALDRPMPVWPDAMRGYAAPVHGAVAQVWSAEQDAAGLHAAVPLWAILRALSLLGCALLAAVIYQRCAYRRTA